MSDKFYTALTEILSKQQLSISGISRELKKYGYDYHRLIITGYLRALEDTGHVRKEEIPPSKVYTHLRVEKNIYELIARELEGVAPENRLNVSVHLLTSLFGRPCFKHELKLLGIPNPQSSAQVCKSTQENLNKLRADITKISIPLNDTAFVPVENAEPPVEVVSILLQLLKEHLNLEGLRAKHQQTTLS